MRLDKFLADCGKGSRKEIKQLIKEGIVTVNDICIKDGAHRVLPEKDKICIENVPIIYKPFLYLMLNKPKDYVSAVFDKRYPVVTDFVPPCYAHYEVYPVGRLDIDTEGLIILTNDGDLCHRLLSPKSHVDKTYFVRCRDELSSRDTEAFFSGVTLDDGYRTMSARLEITPDSREAYLTIQEGKFHQVKRMMEAVGNKVEYLKRISMGGVFLDESLSPGEIRELTGEELELLSQKNK